MSFLRKEPVSTHISLPNGNTFNVGADISIQCEVRGYPQPIASWFKDDVEIQQSQRIRISGKSPPTAVPCDLPTIYYFHLPTLSDAHTLTIYGANAGDSGNYKCEARNQYSQSFHVEQINVEGNIVVFITGKGHFFTMLRLLSPFCVGVYVPEGCTDNQFFAKCELIVKGHFCTHKYYAKFCCKSCTLAGQLTSYSIDTNLLTK